MKDMTGKDMNGMWAYARPLSLTEAAEWAGVSPRTIRRMASQGVIGVKATDKFWVSPSTSWLCIFSALTLSLTAFPAARAASRRHRKRAEEMAISPALPEMRFHARSRAQQMPRSFKHLERII